MQPDGWKRAGQLTALAIIILALLDWTGVYHARQLWELISNTAQQVIQQIRPTPEQREVGSRSGSKSVMEATPVPKAPSGWVYRETRQPSFTLLVPDGWTATKTEDGVKLASRENINAYVTVFGDSYPPDWYIKQLQKGPAFRRIIESGQLQLGGQKEVYMIFTAAVGGAEGIFKVSFTSYNHHMYYLLMGGRSDLYSGMKRDMDRIEASFSVGSISR